MEQTIFQVDYNYDCYIEHEDMTKRVAKAMLVEGVTFGYTEATTHRLAQELGWDDMRITGIKQTKYADFITSNEYTENTMRTDYQKEIGAGRWLGGKYFEVECKYLLDTDKWMSRKYVVLAQNIPTALELMERYNGDAEWSWQIASAKETKLTDVVVKEYKKV